MSILFEEAGESVTSLASRVSDIVKMCLGQPEKTPELYQRVLAEVESPLFRAVMEFCKYNQSKAADMLGISRGTLRTKLRLYFDDKYVGSRVED